jgi:hypothetical protein
MLYDIEAEQLERSEMQRRAERDRGKVCCDPGEAREGVEET